jgi:hypothetical protein
MEKKIQTIYDIIKKYDKIELTDRETQLGCDEINIIVDTLKDVISTLKTCVTEDKLNDITSRLNTVEGKTYVDSIGGKKGAITLNSGSTADGAVNFAIDADGKITAITVLTGYAKTSALNSYLTKTDAGTTYATKTDLQNAQKTLGDSIAENTTNINANTSSISVLKREVNANTTAISELGETYLTAIAASKVEYDEWETIVAATN